MRQGEGTELDLSTSLQRAAARTSRAMLEHTVVVDRHKGPSPRALCGQVSRYGWILMPSGLNMNSTKDLRRCPKCERLEEEQSHG